MLAWDPPVLADRDLAMLRYRITVVAARTPEKHEAVHLTPGSETVLVVPVFPSRWYIFFVDAESPERTYHCAKSTELLTDKATPSAPAAVQVSDVQRDSITLTWKPSDDDGGAPIERHSVLVYEWGSDRHTLIRVDEVYDSKPTHRAERLHRNTPYFFQVRAVNARGAGECSDDSEAVATLPGPPDAPPAAPVAQSAGVATRVQLSWQAPMADGGLPITHYNVSVRRVGYASGALVQPGADMSRTAGADDECWEVRADGPRLAHTVTGLVAGARYEFSICAANTAGDGPSSASSGPVRAGPRAPGPAGTPQFHGPAGMPPYDSVLSFAAPQDMGDATVDGYRCIAFSRGRPELTKEVFLHILGADGDVITALAMGLGNHEYQFSVQAHNAGGWGALGESSEPALIWRPTPPGRPGIVSAQATTLALTWMAALDRTGSVLMSYVVHVRHHRDDGVDQQRDDEEWQQQVVDGRRAPADGASDLLAAEITGLQGGQTYSFCVQAAEGDEPRPISEESPLVVLPASPPQALGKPLAGEPSLVDDKSGNQTVSVQLSWMACTDRETSVLGYRVHVHKLASAAVHCMLGVTGAAAIEAVDTENIFPLEAPWVESSKAQGVAALEGSKAAPAQTMTGLKPGSLYCFLVQAISGGGATAPSPRSALVATPPAAPSSCRSLVVRRVALGAVRVSWQPPAESGGAKVDSYEIAVSMHSDGPATRVERLATTSGRQGVSGFWMRHVVEDLVPGEEYHVSVVATSEVGTGRTNPNMPLLVDLRAAWPLVDVDA